MIIFKKYKTLIIFIILLSTCVVFCNSYTVLTFKNLSKKPIIIIDPGHGHPDAGACSVNNIYEKDLNLKISLKLKKILEKHGAKVILTRKDDNSLSNSKTNNKNDDLKKRAKIRDTSNADIFISIHMNHFSDSRYTGAQVFYNNSYSENEKLAKLIQDNLVKHADRTNTRKIKNDNNIYILKNSKIPTVLVECGFLSNVVESNKLNTDKYQNILAEAISKGIIKYIKGV